MTQNQLEQDIPSGSFPFVDKVQKDRETFLKMQKEQTGTDQVS